MQGVRHPLVRQRLVGSQQGLGEDLTAELKGMLARWLFNHIRSDDKSYSKHVRHYLETYKGGAGRTSRDGWFKRRVKAWLQ